MDNQTPEAAGPEAEAPSVTLVTAEKPATEAEKPAAKKKPSTSKKPAAKAAEKTNTRVSRGFTITDY